MSILYKMDCSSEQTNEHFTCYIITREGEAIEGIGQEEGYTIFCIRGVYKNDLSEIAFLRVSCVDLDCTPRVFVFKDSKKGCVSEFDLFRGFDKWSEGWTIKLEELEEDEFFKCRIATRLKHRELTLNGIAKQLLDNAQVLKTFM